jgi:hypothetical protein
VCWWRQSSSLMHQKRQHKCERFSSPDRRDLTLLECITSSLQISSILFLFLPFLFGDVASSTFSSSLGYRVLPFNGQWLVQELATGLTSYLPPFAPGGSGVWHVYTDVSGFDAITQGGAEPPMFAATIFQAAAHAAPAAEDEGRPALQDFEATPASTGDGPAGDDSMRLPPIDELVEAGQFES